MANGCISTGRILAKLDEYLGKNDYVSAERHLMYWLSESQALKDDRTEILMRNELMGLLRKLGRGEEAIAMANATLDKIELLGIGEQLGAATAFLNAATVYKAFGRAEEAIPIFERASVIYERELESTDSRRAGLYNNMALALVDLGRFAEAKELYRRALSVLESDEMNAPEMAITYLNLASAAEAEKGLLLAESEINEHLDTAERLLDGCALRDGNYAFVCEKCASVFGYYGRFFYENELLGRARRIYGNEGN